MSDSENPACEPEDLRPKVREDIESALEAAGELSLRETPTAWAVGVAVNELFNDVWRKAVESAPDGARLVDIRREADRVAHETIALAIAYLTIHDAAIEERIENLDGTDRIEIESHALWLSEYLQRFG